MGRCEFRSSCELLDVLKEISPFALEETIDGYCDSSYSLCAGYMIQSTCGPGKVPKYLFPDDIQEACKIIGELGPLSY